METFAAQLQSVQLLAEQQINRLVGTDAVIQQSFLFNEAKFTGVRWSSGACTVEWTFASDFVTVSVSEQPLAKIALALSGGRRAA